MKKFLCIILKGYKKHISPVFEHFGIHCKFYPSCSEYMMEAINKYGALKGVFLGIKRLIRCNPFAKGGYDPLK